MGDDAKTVLRDNVRRLLSLQPGESGVQKLIGKGFPNGTAQRVLGGDTSVGLDVLDRLAGAFGMPAWRLLAPDLGGAAPSSLDQLTPHESMLLGILRERGKDAARGELARLQGELAPPGPAPTAWRAGAKRP